MVIQPERGVDCKNEGMIIRKTSITNEDTENKHKVLIRGCFCWVKAVGLLDETSNQFLN